MSSSRRSTIIVEHLRKQQMWEAISKGKGLDGRNLDEIRPIEAEVNVIRKANGSSKVNLGNSEVVAGVKVETGRPFEGLENKGALILSAEILLPHLRILNLVLLMRKQLSWHGWLTEESENQK